MEDTPPRQSWESPDQPTEPEPGAAPGYGAPPPPADGAPPPPPPGYAAPPPAPGYGAPPVPPGHGAPPAWDSPVPPVVPPAAAGWGAAPPSGQWGGVPGPPLRPKPGIIPLRPISLGEMYDGSFQAMRSNPRTMIGLGAVVIGIASLVTLVPETTLLVSAAGIGDAASTGEGPSTAELATLGAGALGFFVGAVLQWLAVTVLTGLLIVAVSEAVLGRRIGPGEVWRRSKAKVWPLIGLSLLTGLATVLAVAVAVVPGVVVIVLSRGEVVGVLIGGLLLLVSVLAVGIRLWAGWSLAPPALLLENRGVVESMRRSWALSKGSIWRVFGILLLTTIIVSIASAIIVGPLTVVSLAVGDGSTLATVLLQVLNQLGSAAAGAIFYPFQAAVTALLYIDLRMRREGLDVELIRATEGAPG